MSNTLIPWLTLHLAPNFSDRTKKVCLEHYSIEEFCQLTPNALQAIGLKPETIQAVLHPNQKAIEEIQRWASLPHHTLLTLQSEYYPRLLKEIPDPPLLLYVLGNPALLNNKQIAIVGSRKATSQGIALAEYFSRQLSEHNIVITSGLALGIDSAAHRVAKKTIAVLGTGIDLIYPARNRDLADKICENGAIVSEFKLKTEPRHAHFPRRNRIISGLTQGTLIIEANRRSGSLITARLALEQGRELFAIPGSPLDSSHTGCNWLIQQGAKLVTSAADIVEELPKTEVALKITHPTSKLDMDHNKLLECIGFDATTFEQLIESTGLSTHKLAVLLCNLKLTGYIKETLDGYSRVIQT